MEITETIDKFKNVFEPQLLQEIEKVATMDQASTDEVILDYGQVVVAIPILSSGSIKVTRVDSEGREILLYYVNSQESCAMTFTCCMEQFPSEIKATAVTNVEFLKIPVHYMDIWLTKYPTWKSFVMGTIRNRFNEMLTIIDQIAFKKLDERLVSYLLEKSKNINSKLLNVSHEDIANDLATSRVVISRLLKKLENEGVLLLYRNQIKLLEAFYKFTL